MATEVPAWQVNVNTVIVWRDQWWQEDGGVETFAIVRNVEYLGDDVEFVVEIRPNVFRQFGTSRPNKVEVVQ